MALIKYITEMDSEMFIYLGFCFKTHCFLHTINKGKYNSDTAMQVYNCMVNETMISDKDHAVVVFEVYSDKIDVLIIEHVKRRGKYYKDDLEGVLQVLLGIKREHNVLVFKYIYDKDCFETYELPIEMPHFDNVGIKINEINYSLSLKPIEYLE